MKNLQLADPGIWPASPKPAQIAPAPAANDNASPAPRAPTRLRAAWIKARKPGWSLNPLRIQWRGKSGQPANDNAAPTALGAVAAAAFALVAGLDAPARAGEAAVELPIVPMGMMSGDISRFPKWSDMLRRYERERHLEDAPCTESCALPDWKAFVRGLLGKAPMRQLQAVNEYVNRTPYQTDAARYGLNDHWATPREFLGRSGDCEDYAIAKYLSLRKLGWPARALRILILNDDTRGLHAVLVADLDGVGYVLDNLSGSVRPLAALRHYRPIFSINELGWEQHRAPLAALTLPHVAFELNMLNRFAGIAEALPAPGTAAGATVGKDEP